MSWRCRGGSNVTKVKHGLSLDASSSGDAEIKSLWEILEQLMAVCLCVCVEVCKCAREIESVRVSVCHYPREVHSIAFSQIIQSYFVVVLQGKKCSFFLFVLQRNRNSKQNQ